MGDNLPEMGELELQVMAAGLGRCADHLGTDARRLDRMMLDKKQLDQLSKWIEEARQRQK